MPTAPRSPCTARLRRSKRPSCISASTATGASTPIRIMSMSNESYSRPRSHEEALHILGQGDAEALAGGTYLLGRRTRRAARLVDLDCLGLDYFKGDEAGVRCGS